MFPDSLNLIYSKQKITTHFPSGLSNSAETQRILSLFSLLQVTLAQKDASSLLSWLHCFFLDADRPSDAELVKRIANIPEKDLDRFVSSISKSQILSKVWLLQELRPFLPKKDSVIYILGGWTGILPFLIFRLFSEKAPIVRSVDIDPSCEFIAEEINRFYVINNWMFKAITADMLNICYNTPTLCALKQRTTDMELLYDRPDVLINTSCEHLNDFSGWWEKVPKGMLVALQSNNAFNEPDHTACHHNLDEFLAAAPMTKTFFCRELILDKYVRYMLIGVK